MSDDPFEYVTPPLKIVRDMVAIPRAQHEALVAAQKEIQALGIGECVSIPRAQHEALMAAAKALHHLVNNDGKQRFTKGERALAALRAAGILEGNK